MHRVNSLGDTDRLAEAHIGFGEEGPSVAPAESKPTLSPLEQHRENIRQKKLAKNRAIWDALTSTESAGEALQDVWWARSRFDIVD